MYSKSRAGWIKHLDFLVLDLLCVNFSFVVAFLLKFGGDISSFSCDDTDKFVIILNIIAVLVALLSKSYKNILKRGYYKELVSVFKYVLLVFLSSAFYLFAIDNDTSASLRDTVYIMAAFLLFLDYVCRVVWKRLLRYKLKNTADRSMLVVTTSNIAEKVIGNLKTNELDTFKVSGVVIIDKNLIGKKIKGVPVVAGLDDAADYVCREWVDEIFVNVHSNKTYPEKLVNEFETMGLVVHNRLVNTSKTDPKRQMVENIGGYTVLTSTINSASALQLFVKRMFDIIGGIIGCVLTAVIFVFVAPMIYIKSPGPVFFKQERVGKNGKKFKFYKFRTMYLDAEERKQELMEQNRVKDGMMFKLDFDPRIIGSKRLENGKTKKGVGGWLRVLSIDEFPQFFNVLKGEMSIVGTRPPTLDEWEKYELHHRARLAIKPGITGMWQANGRSEITDFEKVVELDTSYIRDWSLVLDIKILFKTVLTVFKREGSM
jgi:exopolysaccharide biosynthesis polyprenyl glycosylphosphotransferase